MLPILVKNAKHIGSEHDGEYDQCEEYRYRRQEETTTIDEDAIAVVGKPIVKSPHLGEVDVGIHKREQERRPARRNAERVGIKKNGGDRVA